MFVSDFKVEPAPGYYQEKGMSHRVTVTISHPWPRPKWWGTSFHRQLRLDPLNPEKLNALPPNAKRENLFEDGAVFTLADSSQAVVWPRGGSAMGTWPAFDGANCVMEYYINADQLPASPKAITFHGLYRFAGSAPLDVTQVLRKKGQTLPTKANRDAGAQLLSIDALPFYKSSSYPVGKAPIASDNCSIYFLVRQTSGDQSAQHKPNLNVYDLLVRDEKGKNYTDYKPKGFNFGYGGAISDQQLQAQLRPDETLTFVDVSIEQATPTSGELTFSGKISVDEHWPIPFKVQLPPRALSGRDNVELPQWKRPTNIAPIR